MKKSFTLLEMLVVLGIIAVLVGFGAVNYSTAQRKARDAKRRGDLKAAQQIMEQCYSVNTSSYQYPIITNSSGTLTSAACPGNASLTFTLVDPLDTGTYKYSINPNPTTISAYKITADLETSTTDFFVENQQ